MADIYKAAVLAQLQTKERQRARLSQELRSQMRDREQQRERTHRENSRPARTGLAVGEREDQKRVCSQCCRAYKENVARSPVRRRLG